MAIVQFTGNSSATSVSQATLTSISNYPSTWSGALKSSLVSYWGLDGHLRDSYASNHGTASANTNYTASSLGGSQANFANSNDKITVNATPFQRTNFTWAGWIKVSSSSTNGTLLSTRYYNGTNYYGYELFYTGQFLNFTNYIGSGVSQSQASYNAFTKDQKMHIALTYNAGSFNLYKNGSLVYSSSSMTAPAFVDTLGPVNIGSNSAYGGYAGSIGTIDELGFWNSALAASDVLNLYSSYSTFIIGSANVSSTAAANLRTASRFSSSVTSTSTLTANLATSIKLVGSVSSTSSTSANLTTRTQLDGSATSTAALSANLTTDIKLIGAATATSTVRSDLMVMKYGLISYYNFNNYITEDAFDQRNGTAVGGVGIVQNIQDGVYGSSAAFDGTGYILLDNKTSLALESFTISGWVITGNASSLRYIFQYWNQSYGYRGFAIRKNLDQKLEVLLGYDNEVLSFTSTSVINTAEWTHFGVSYDAATSQLKIYINGVLEQQGTANRIYYNNTCEAAIGAMAYSNGVSIDYAYPWIGNIDEIGIWNRALSSGEMQNLVNFSYSSAKLVGSISETRNLPEANLTTSIKMFGSALGIAQINNADLTTEILMLADVTGNSQINDADLFTSIQMLGSVDGTAVSEASLVTQTLFSGDASSLSEVSATELLNTESLKINDLIYETELIAYKLAKFVRGFNLNDQKITHLAAGSATKDAVTYGQLTNISSSLKNYIDVADADFLSTLEQTSGSVKDYVDASDILLDAAINNLSSSLTNYIDAADSIINIATQQLSSSLKTYIDARDEVLNQNIINASSSLTTYIDSQDTALQSSISDTSSSILAYAQDMISVVSATLASLSGAINNSLSAESNKRISDDEKFVKLDGSRVLSGNLNLDNNHLINVNSASFTGDLTINGGLTVNGDYMAVNKLDVSDSLITISKNALDGNAADGSGIFVDGANISFTYDNQSGKWLSNIGLSIASEAGFGAAIKLSGSTFTNITTIVTNNKFDLGSAIHDLDAALQQQAERISETYDSIRLIVVGQIVDGQAIINLTSVGGIQFSTTEIDSISLDVLISEDGASYTDNFVSSKIYIEGNNIKVLISSPAVSNGSYRLIAINQKQRILLP